MIEYKCNVIPSTVLSARVTSLSFDSFQLRKAVLKGRFHSNVLMETRQKCQKTGSGCREGSRLDYQQTYPKLLHFFFLEGGHQEQRSIGKGWTGREKRKGDKA